MHKATKYPGISKESGGTWKLRVTATCRRTGKRKDAVRTLPGTMTEPEVLSQFARIKQELEGQAPVSSPLGNSGISVADYAKSWLGRKAERVRPSVAVNYEAKLSLYILPKLGKFRLHELRREDIEAWVTWAETAKMKSGKSFARDTVTGWWRILTTFVKDAVAELSLPSDPTNRVRPPKAKPTGRREKATLSAEELGKVLDAVKELAPDRYAEAYTMAYSGMRAGEAYALTWDDVQFERGRILVRKSVWNGHVDATKTDAPREVALTDGMAEVLRSHRKQLERDHHRGLRTGLVFPGDHGGHRGATSLHKPLAQAARSAGLTTRVTPQVLRRTVNTLLLLAGVDRIVIRAQMGHISEQMTERYAGVPISAKHDALARMERRGKPTNG